MSQPITSVYINIGIPVEEPIAVKGEKAAMFESVPAAPLLDTSVSRSKAQLAASSPRRPPTKQRPKVGLQSE